MIEIKDKTQCCGCTACVSVCPRNCILMEEDDEGFKYPIVNTTECIGCNLCEKVCPIENKLENKFSTVAYVSYSRNDEIRENSSSGGLFSMIAEHILENDGIVLGATFDSFFNVKHTYIDKLEDLYLLRGSKYVQSNLEGVFSDVKKFIIAGRKVLFSGTECQIEGLKHYLGKYDNELLYTVDILCHGVPNSNLWQKYLNWLEQQHKSNICSVSFRNKKYGWKKYQMYIEFSDGTSYQNDNATDPFFKFFLYNICLRPSCHKCVFKDINRNSDITLGDCWQVHTHSPEMDDDKGTSVVLIHTERGKELFNSIKHKTKYKEIDIADAIPSYAESLNSAIPHMNRKKFFEALQQDKDIPELLQLLNLSLIQRIKRKISNSLKHN